MSLRAAMFHSTGDVTFSVDLLVLKRVNVSWVESVGTENRDVTRGRASREDCRGGRIGPLSRKPRWKAPAHVFALW